MKQNRHGECSTIMETAGIRCPQGKCQLPGDGPQVQPSAGDWWR